MALAADPELGADLVERAQLLTELSGPEVEAWVSGLFSVFESTEERIEFVEFVGAERSVERLLLVAAMASLGDGEVARHAGEMTASISTSIAVDDATRAVLDAIGCSVPLGAWAISARFGMTVMVAFGPDGSTEADHSVMFDLDIDDDEHITDIQLAGPSADLIEEAAADRAVEVTPMELPAALDRVTAAWRRTGVVSSPGIESNQYFARQRLVSATGVALDPLVVVEPTVDLSRGLNESEYDAANAAALSTLRAAVGATADAPQDAPGAAAETWAGIVQGWAGDLSPRARDGLLWLEWADWLGVGIGVHRSADDLVVNGEVFVDLVNRCPEVSSSIAAGDRDYAIWAFDVALDCLGDAGLIDQGVLTPAGRSGLVPGLVRAWTSPLPT